VQLEAGLGLGADLAEGGEDGLYAGVGQDLLMLVCGGVVVDNEKKATLSTMSRSWISEQTETRFPRSWLMALPGRKWGSLSSSAWVSTMLWTSQRTFSALLSASCSWRTSAFSTMAMESWEAQGQGSILAVGLVTSRSHEARRAILVVEGGVFRGEWRI
jgi:hypothetical protein